MSNVKFALDTGPDGSGNSWLKYIRSAPSFEEQNLAACHLTGDQVSDSGRTTGTLPVRWSRSVCECVCQRDAVERLPASALHVGAFSPSASEHTWHGVAPGAMPSQ